MTVLPSSLIHKDHESTLHKIFLPQVCVTYSKLKYTMPFNYLQLSAIEFWNASFSIAEKNRLFTLFPWVIVITLLKKLHELLEKSVSAKKMLLPSRRYHINFIALPAVQLVCVIRSYRLNALVKNIWSPFFELQIVSKRFKMIFKLTPSNETSWYELM